MGNSDTESILGAPERRGFTGGRGCLRMRTSSVIMTLRLFVISLTCMITTSASSAILPSLLDDIYIRNYARDPDYCTNNTRSEDANSTNMTGKENPTESENSCTFPDKYLLIGIFMSYTPLVEVPCTPLVPVIIYYIGVRYSIILAALVKLIGCLLTMQATNLPILFIARFLHGVPVFISLTAGLVATCYQYSDNEKQRQFALTLGLQGIVFGNLVAYLVGSSLYQLLGLRVAFLIMACFSLLELLICFIAKDENEQRENFRIGWCAIIKDSGMLMAFICIIHAFHYFTAWRTLKPEWMFRLGASVVTIGVILATGTVLQLFFTTAADKTKLSPWQKVFLGQIFVIFGFVILPFTNFNFWVSLVPDVMILFGYSITVSCLGSYLAERVEEVLETKAYVIMYTIFLLQTNIGSTTGGPYAGALVESVGFPWTCNITAIVAGVLTIFIVVWIQRDKKRYYEEIPG